MAMATPTETGQATSVCSAAQGTEAGHILKWLLSSTSAWVDQGLFASAFLHWCGGFTGGMRGVALCALSEQGSEGIRAPTDADQGQLLYSICSCLLALSRPVDFNSDKKL